MTKTQAISALRDALVHLYPMRDDTQRIVADAELKPTAIAFNDKAVNNWHNILSEADKHQKVGQLMAIALAEFPNYVPLRQASQAYLAVTGQTLLSGASDLAHAASKDATADQQAMQDLLTRHQRNLLRLQGKKAVYGWGEEPLSLLNQIEHEEQEIARIQAELQKQ